MDDREVRGKYAILSHTWGDSEVTFSDIQDLGRASRKPGYYKIFKTCEQARQDGLNFAWIDTCCINKDSSAELSEAINSMYRWYYEAHICYAYITDLDMATVERDFQATQQQPPPPLQNDPPDPKVANQDPQPTPGQKQGRTAYSSHRRRQRRSRNPFGDFGGMSNKPKWLNHKNDSDSVSETEDAPQSPYLQPTYSSATTDETRSSYQSEYQQGVRMSTSPEPPTPPAPQPPRAVSQQDYWKRLKFSRWRTRGWTLQELIAPKDVQFFDATWKFLGNRSDTGFAPLLSEFTGISLQVLVNRDSLKSTSLAGRMSWAAERSTTRVEDQAYCLLGLLGVNMPLLYGEGERAFERLQEELLRTQDDLSLLVWEPHRPAHSQLLLAPDPYCFRAIRGSGAIRPARSDSIASLGHDLNHRGLRIRLPLRLSPRKDYLYAAINCIAGKALRENESSWRGGRVVLAVHKINTRDQHTASNPGRSCYEVVRFRGVERVQNELDWLDVNSSWRSGVYFEDVILFRRRTTLTIALDLDPRLEVVEAFPTSSFVSTRLHYCFQPIPDSTWRNGSEGWMRLRDKRMHEEFSLGFRSNFEHDNLVDTAVCFMPNPAFQEPSDLVGFCLNFPEVEAKWLPCWRRQKPRTYGNLVSSGEVFFAKAWNARTTAPFPTDHDRLAPNTVILQVWLSTVGMLEVESHFVGEDYDGDDRTTKSPFSGAEFLSGASSYLRPPSNEVVRALSVTTEQLHP